mgnify:CR=1 FL=1
MRGASPTSGRGGTFGTLADGYGWRVIVSVPFTSGPSHESAPEYKAVSVSGVIPVTVAVRLAEHMGVTSLGFPAGFPAGRDIVNVSVVPTIAPESVPVLFR